MYCVPSSMSLFSFYEIISPSPSFLFFFFNDTATTEISTLSLHDALPISRAPIPAPTHHPGAAVVNGRLFVAGGYSGRAILRWTPLATVYEYDEARNSWATRAPLGSPRGALAVVALGGRLHAIGGSNGQVTGAHEVYDPETDRWTEAPAMPTARDHLAAVAFQGRLWALGGRESFLGKQYATVEVYDPATTGWSTRRPLPTSPGGLAAA